MTDYFHLNAAPDTVRAISSLGLAHLGDGVFELMVRSWLCLHGKATSKGLHRATVRYVAAPAQARAVERILPLLTGEEGDVFRRGRNTSPHMASFLKSFSLRISLQLPLHRLLFTTK